MERQIELAKSILENAGYTVSKINEARYTYVLVNGDSPNNGIFKFEATSDEEAKAFRDMYVQGKPRALAARYRVVKDRPEYTAYQDLHFVDMKDYIQDKGF